MNARRELRNRDHLMRRLRGVIVVAGALLLVLSDTPVIGLSEFWAMHVIISSVAIGVLTIAVGIVLIDDYLAARERHQWESVAVIAFQDLAREVMLITRMMGEVTGESDFRKRSARPLSDSSASHVHELLDSLLGSIDDRRKTKRTERLAALVREPLWVELTYLAMQDRIHEGRLTISRWAPVMVNNEPLAIILTKVAKAVQDIELIQLLLVRLHVDRQSPSEDDVRTWLDAWDPYEKDCRTTHALLVPGAYLYKIHRDLDA